MSAQRKPEPSAPNEAPRGLQREHAALVARSLRVLANATRLQLLSGILGAADGRATVRTLTDAVGLRQPTVSQHLHLMLESGVVEREPIGREVWYSIHPDLIDTVTDLVT
ncbi:ArsR/SmtB family transcription factor [Ornithinimicrobium ciconiae]|nr:metalloregulator ArsR/SmtB family transcription factor [Ornithinimicrobium ciconiae]